MGFVQEDLGSNQAQPFQSSRASANIVHSLAVGGQFTGSASRKRKSVPADSGSNDASYDFSCPMPETGSPLLSFPAAFKRVHTGNKQQHCLAEAAYDHCKASAPAACVKVCQMLLQLRNSHST